MKVYISADLEGISGVVHDQQGEMGNPEYERARKLMTAEVNAAIEGALAQGATAILVNDSHGSMRNLLIEELNPAAELISGAPKPLSMMQGIDEGFDIAFFIGYHAQGGTAASVLDHTYTSRIHEVALNDRPMSEAGLNAALAGYYGVPVALITGDQLAVNQLAELIGPKLQAVAVKWSYGRNAARCLPPAIAARRIREAVARAMIDPPPPFTVTSPIILSLTFVSSAHADMAALIPGSQRVGGRRITYTHEDYQTVFKVWRAMLALASTV